ncbi:glycosyltransferase family 4 protein [Barrientosiimonas humi]|uniref:glycosyltransferase family 4 protein n=1 Tax=Barrientosiimonas humi TaxID=999931 RepID=UPI00370D930B
MLNWRDLGHPEAGGAEKYLVEVAKGLAARGHDVTFRTAAYPGSLVTESDDWVRYVRKGGHYSIYPRALASQFVGRLRGDVVIDVQNGVPFLSPVARIGAPVINLVHHVHREQWPVAFPPRLAAVGWQLESRLAPRIYRRCPYVAVSPTTKNELIELGVDSQQITVIPNGTDARPMASVARATHPLVVVLGRLVPHKRVEIAIRAVHRLRPRYPDIELRIVGSGYWDRELRQLVSSLDLDGSVTFTGHVSEGEKHRQLAEAWVHALPSIKEGWGLVVVEAGVQETPSLAFRDAGGTKDSIRDGQTGLLVPAGQEAFTNALDRLLSDRELRERLGHGARTWSMGFRWEDSIAAWEDLISVTVKRSAEDD